MFSTTNFTTSITSTLSQFNISNVCFETERFGGPISVNITNEQQDQLERVNQMLEDPWAEPFTMDVSVTEFFQMSVISLARMAINKRLNFYDLVRMSLEMDNISGKDKDYLLGLAKSEDKNDKLNYEVYVLTALDGEVERQQPNDYVHFQTFISLEQRRINTIHT